MDSGVRGVNLKQPENMNANAFFAFTQGHGHRVPTFNGVDFVVTGVGYRFETKMAVEIWNLLRMFTCLIFALAFAEEKTRRTTAGPKG